MFYIIRKVSSVEGVLSYTPIGYVLSIEDEAYMNDEIKMAHAEQWLIANFPAIKSGSLNPAVYFETNPSFYIGGFTTQDVTGMGINLITNLDNPEGV